MATTAGGHVVGFPCGCCVDIDVLTTRDRTAKEFSPLFEARREVNSTMKSSVPPFFFLAAQMIVVVCYQKVALL